MIFLNNRSNDLGNSPRVWDDGIQRVLLIRLRAIGDTVLFTPCLEVLKRWRPELEIDVLIEPLSAPVLQGNPHLTKLFVIPRSKLSWLRFKERAAVISALRERQYDLAIDLRGYKTSATVMGQVRAQQSVSFAECPLSHLATHRIASPHEIWGKPCTHNVEQQLAPLKWLGVPVEEIPPRACSSIRRRTSAWPGAWRCWRLTAGLRCCTWAPPPVGRCGNPPASRG